MNFNQTVRFSVTGVGFRRESETFTGSVSVTFDGAVAAYSYSVEVIGYNHLTDEQIADPGNYPSVVAAPDYEAEADVCGEISVIATGSNAYSGQVVVALTNTGEISQWVDPDWEVADNDDASMPVPNGTSELRVFVGDPAIECDPGGGGGGGDPAPEDVNPMSRREHLTRLLSWTIEGGATRLVAGTRSRLYVDTGDGNWQIIGAIQSICPPYEDDYLHVPAGRFMVETIGNLLFAAHTEGTFWTWSPGSPFFRNATYGHYESWQPVDDLIALDIREAKALCESNGFILIGGTVEENQGKPGVVRWSDYNDPRAWAPGGESLAGYADLGNGEGVLAIKRLHTGVRVFTRSSIWAGEMVGGSEVWRFIRIYSGPLTLAYPESVVATDDGLWFVTHSGLAFLGPVDRTPQTAEWLDDAAAFIHSGVRDRWMEGLPEGVASSRCAIDDQSTMCCIGGWSREYNLLLFFWATNIPDWPDTGIAIDLGGRTSCVLDFGATAICTHSPREGRTLRRAVAEDGVCDASAEINEGDPLPVAFVRDESIFYLVHPDEGSGIYPAFDLSEVDLESAAPHGWWAKMHAAGSCCPDCNSPSSRSVTLIAMVDDQSIKELDVDYFARQVIDTSFTPPPWQEEQAEDGQNESSFQPHPTRLLREGDISDTHYCLLWQTDSLYFNTPGPKIFRNLAVSHESQLAVAECLDGAENSSRDIGVSASVDWLLNAQVSASNSASCQSWSDFDPQVIDCREQQPADQVTRKPYDKGNPPMVFRFNERGAYLTIRLWADGRSTDVNHVGPLALTSLTLEVGQDKSRW